MKTNFCYGAILAFAVVGFGCGGSTNNNTSHAGMNHNSNTAVDHSKMDHGGTDHSMMQSSPNAASAPYDLQFLDTMIVHHQGAVDMAVPCGAKAQHGEIKTLCADIITSQQKEIAEM